MDKVAPLSLWSTVFQPKEAKIVGMIKDGVSAGQAFITEHKRGKGKIVMLGSLPEGDAGDNLLSKLIHHYAEEADVRLKTDVSIGTIVAPRDKNGEVVWVIVNMDGKGGTVTLPSYGIDALTGESISKGIFEIGPFQHKIIRFINY